MTLIPASAHKYKNIVSRSVYEKNISFFSMLASNYGQEKNAQRFLIGSKKSLSNYLTLRDDIDSENPGQKAIKAREFIDKMAAALT